MGVQDERRPRRARADAGPDGAPLQQEATSSRAQPRRAPRHAGAGRMGALRHHATRAEMDKKQDPGLAADAGHSL